MDGFGRNDDNYGNAIYSAATPNLDKIMSENPMTFIGASGMDVGLPDGQMGNSEVGHTNIGAGRVVYQELTRITKSIADGDFFENEALCREEKLAIVLGTEGDGLAETTIAQCDYTVKIPMSHGVDSLNVAAASAIAFWELG